VSTRAQELSVSIGRVVSGPIWHGPALMDLIGDVTAEQAAARPIAGAHTIWELVLHLTAWAEIVRMRITNPDTPEPTAEQDWPGIEETTAEAWRAAVERLKDAHRELAVDVGQMDETRVRQRVSGRDYDALVMLHGVVEHDAYHGGQIALLKRALEHQDRR
jgi:uncharacterized damage-inducible protein DinB